MTSLTELHIPVPVHYGDLLESLSLLQELTINFEAQSQDRPPPILISDAAVVTKFECNSMYLVRCCFGYDAPSSHCILALTYPLEFQSQPRKPVA
jgi:hypothetical protein